VRPDPKPGRRRAVADPAALRRAALRRRECAACGEPGANGHHVVERDDGGDDVDENIVTLCGSGTYGCHGALHGNPYVAEVVAVHPSGRTRRHYERRDRAWVGRRVGDHLRRERPETVAYVLAKLGPFVGRHYLVSRYGLDPGSAETRPDTLPA
jgi:hypothetical protein